MKYEFDGHELDLTASEDGMLMWPTAWSEYLLEHKFFDAAAAILSALPECAVRVPWLIGSTNVTLLGRERTESNSHSRGLAFDMSPMFSKDAILNPSGSIMGLAWNVVSLVLISKAYVKFPHFVVEGDHLHVQPGAQLPADTLLSVFSMPSWYPWTDIIRSDADASSLDGSFWQFDIPKARLSLCDGEEVVKFIQSLRV